MSGCCLSAELEARVLAELRRRTPRRGMVKLVAHDLEVSGTLIYQVLHGDRRPSLKLAAKLGMVSLVDPEKGLRAEIEALEPWRDDQLQFDLPVS